MQEIENAPIKSGMKGSYEFTSDEKVRSRAIALAATLTQFIKGEEGGGAPEG
jgi:hypothetical protein